MGLVNKGVVLGEEGQAAAAMAVLDQVVERHGAASEPGLRERVAIALVNKGVVLGEEGQAAATAVYDHVVERHGAASESGLRELARLARSERKTAD